MELSIDNNKLLISYGNGAVDRIARDNIKDITIRGGDMLKLFRSRPKKHVRIPYDDVSSPSFASFADMVEYVSDFKSSTQAFVFTVSASEASSDEIDLSAYGVSSIDKVFQNDAYIPSSSFSFADDTLSLSVDIAEDDILTIFAK